MEVEGAIFSGQPVPVLGGGKAAGGKTQGFFEAFLSALSSPELPGGFKTAISPNEGCGLIAAAWPQAVDQPEPVAGEAVFLPELFLSCGYPGPAAGKGEGQQLPAAGEGELEQPLWQFTQLSEGIIPAGGYMPATQPGAMDLALPQQPAADLGEPGTMAPGQPAVPLPALREAGAAFPELIPVALADQTGIGLHRFFGEDGGGPRTTPTPAPRCYMWVKTSSLGEGQGEGSFTPEAPAVLPEQGAVQKQVPQAADIFHEQIKPGLTAPEKASDRSGAAQAQPVIPTAGGGQGEGSFTPEAPAVLPEQGAAQKQVPQAADIFHEQINPGLTAPEKASDRSGAAQAQPVIPTAEPAASSPAKTYVSPPETVKDAAFKEQIMQKIQGRLIYIHEKGAAPAEMRLQLQPAEWGEMVIRVFSRQGRLSAVIQVEAAVMEILEGSLPELRQRLQQSNLPLEHLELFAAGREDLGRGRFGGGHFFPEERRFDQGSLASVTGERQHGQAADNPASGGIEYWA